MSGQVGAMGQLPVIDAVANVPIGLAWDSRSRPGRHKWVNDTDSEKILDVAACKLFRSSTDQVGPDGDGV